MAEHAFAIGCNPTGQDTTRGPSNTIWGRFFNPGDLRDPSVCLEFFDDFNDFPGFVSSNQTDLQLGKWTAFTDNNSGVKMGTSADTTNLPLEGGVLGITSGANNNLGGVLAANESQFRIISPASGYPLQNDLAFECRVAFNKTAAVATGQYDAFFGLMDTGDGGTRITSATLKVFQTAAAGLYTASGNGGCIGFHKRATTNPTDIGVVYNVNNGTPQYPGAAATLQKLSLNSGVGAVLSTFMNPTSGDPGAGTFIKLGFVYQRKPTLSKNALAAITTNQTVGTPYGPMIRFFVNGQELGWFLIATDVQASTFPSSFLAPVIAFQTGASASANGIVYVDWIKVGQYVKTPQSFTV
jgi:hypothetical protein